MTPGGGIPRELTALTRPALLAAAVGAGLLIVGFLIPPFHAQVFRAYLFAWLFILGLSTGSLAILMLNHLVPGEWGWLLRRMAEAAAMNLPIVALLFVPVLLGLGHLFPWADAHAVASDRVLQHKAAYLNKGFFLARAAIYFAVWIALAFVLRHLSLENDRTGERRPLRRAQRVSAAGVVLYVITMSFAAVDWVLSRDAHWFSTILGLLVVVSQAAAGMAFLVFMGTRVSGRDPLAPVIEPKHLNDWGNLLLTLVILWAYMSFAQMLIIWMGNLREDVSWYVQRGLSPGHANWWRWLALLLVVFHFFVPFFILLSRDNKRRARTLHAVAALLLVMRVLDVYWWVAPTSGHGSTSPGKVSWFDVPAMLALVGIWLAAWVWHLSGKSLLARGAPEDEQAPGADRGVAHA
jgi:hypothetical protein